jgi:hypothetical protein
MALFSKKIFANFDFMNVSRLMNVPVPSADGDAVNRKFLGDNYVPVNGLVNDINMNLKSLKYGSLNSPGFSYQGVLLILKAGQNISQGQFLYPSYNNGNIVLPSSNSSETTSLGVFVATESKLVNEDVTVMLPGGIIRNSSYSLTVGSIVFINANGYPTTTRPDTGTTILPVGVALTQYSYIFHLGFIPMGL